MRKKTAKKPVLLDRSLTPIPTSAEKSKRAHSRRVSAIESEYTGDNFSNNAGLNKVRLNSVETNPYGKRPHTSTGIGGTFNFKIKHNFTFDSSDQRTSNVQKADEFYRTESQGLSGPDDALSLDRDFQNSPKPRHSDSIKD